MNINKHLDALIHGNHLNIEAYLRKVCKSERIDETSADMHIYMLKLDGNKRPRINDFCDFLINRIVDYCIPPSEIKKQKKKMINLIQHIMLLLYIGKQRDFLQA